MSPYDLLKPPFVTCLISLKASIACSENYAESLPQASPPNTQKEMVFQILPLIAYVSNHNIYHQTQIKNRGQNVPLLCSGYQATIGPDYAELHYHYQW